MEKTLGLRETHPGIKCENCPYWDFFKDAHGICLRYPPSIHVENEDENKANGFRQPLTHQDDVCGEHSFFRPEPSEQVKAEIAARIIDDMKRNHRGK